MSDTKVFPNGFNNWRETHYEIVEKITLHINFWLDNDENLEPEDPIFNIRKEQGFSGLWSLAETWTDEFENLHKGVNWGFDGAMEEFVDVVEDFFNKKIGK